MTLFACRYAIVQFLPYAETGEFANVGVVLLCPEQGYFDYRLQNTRHTKRITTFFDRLDRTVYTKSLKFFQEELVRVKTLLDTEIFARADADVSRQVFAALTHAREAIVRFSPVRAVMTANPAQEIATLFAHYVEHDFATPEHREYVLEKRIGELLHTWSVDKSFQRHRIGNDETRANFPFVLFEDDKPIKAIKPLFLAQDEPHKIFEHADFWLPKMRRLKNRGLLPAATLIPTEAPAEGDAKRFKVFSEVHNELLSLGLQTAPANDENAIRQFALTH
jgi:hypothetical protein